MVRLRGSSLAAVILVVGVAMTLALMLAGSSVFEIHVAASLVTQSRALDLAESAVAQAAAEIMTAESAQQPVSPTLTVSSVYPDGSSLYLTFVQSGPSTPWSCNNLTGTTAVPGWVPGSEVPAGAVELVGTGQCGDHLAEVEAVMHFPAFPYVVASSGSFSSPLGGVTIAQVASQSLLGAGAAAVCPANWLPGDMASNSTQQPAVYLGSNSKVTGNVEASGSIVLAPGVQVQGAVQPFSGPVALPTINVLQDPTAGYGGVQPFTSAPTAAPVTVAGLLRSSASVSIPGNLVLNGALIYVNGDLTVTGILSGTGAVYTTGKMTVSGGAALTTTDMIAVVAGGDVTLNGPPCQSSIFYGLVYTQGSLTANNLQLYGNFVANGGPSTGNITMNNCTVAFVNTMVRLQLAGAVVTTVTTGGCGGSCCTTSGVCAHGICCGPKKYRWTVKKNSCGTYCLKSCPPSPNRCSSKICKCKLKGKFCPGCDICVCTLLAGLAGGSSGPAPPAVVSKLTRVTCCQTCTANVVYSFTFNQFIAPADWARLLIWRQI